MNILTIIILAVFILAVWGGYKKGFLKTAFSLISWALVLVLCNYATPIVTNALIEKTDIEVYVQATIDSKLNEIISETIETSGIAEIEATLPAELKTALLGEGISLQEAVETGVSLDTTAMAAGVVGILGFVVTVVGLRIALVLVERLLTIIGKLPLIGPLDKMLGLVCGIGNGFILSWLVLAGVSVLAFTGTNTELAGYIAQSQLLTWLQDNNVLLNLIVAI